MSAAGMTARRRAGLALAACALALVLAGCGKKPGFVDPPQGKDQDRFPRQYPNPAPPAEQQPGLRFP